MKTRILIMVLTLIMANAFSQIIADHKVISRFEDIPLNYITEVKKMMVAFPGQSHSEAYRTGLELLENIYPEFDCNVGIGEDYTESYLRVENHGWIDEDLWWTWFAYPEGSRPSYASNYFKNTILSYNNAGHPFTAIGFGWCNDLTAPDNISQSTDPVYGVHWYGRSFGGPDGSLSWGLNPGDELITGNSVSLETYFGAMQDYISFCSTSGIPTRIVFTTGPVDIYSADFAGEAGYQGHLKHEAIRDFVKVNPGMILFDYADILCYDDNGSQTTQTWNGHTYPLITETNMGDESIGHIGAAGAIRLAKAQWWLLARIAGWDGGISNCPEDFNNDNRIDGTDYLQLVGRFSTACANCAEDLNSDGVVDGTDYLQLLGRFNNTCY